MCETQTIEEYMAENNIRRDTSRVGLKSWSVIGYTYRADTYCVPCLKENEQLRDANNPDTDGGPIFADSEISDRNCACCGQTLIDVIY